MNSKIKKIGISLVCLCILSFLLIRLPLNKLLYAQVAHLPKEISIIVIDKASVYKGYFYLKMPQQPNLWRIEYRICSFFRWCIEANSGSNQLQSEVSFNNFFESIVSHNLSRINLILEDFSFIAASDVIQVLLPNELTKFAIDAHADQIIISDFSCPSNNVIIENGLVRATDVNIIGLGFPDVIVNVGTSLTNEPIKTTALIKGAVEGELSLQNSVYQGSIMMGNVSRELFTSNADYGSSDWKLNGKLPCRLGGPV